MVKYKGVVYADCGRLQDSILGCFCERCKNEYATIHPHKSTDGKSLCGRCVKEIKIGERYIQELGKEEVFKRFK